MPQSDITKFFSPKAKENRLNISNTSMSPKSPVSGKRKASEVEDEEESSSCKSGILSPDQKKRMLANKLVAKIKVNTRKFPFALHDNIGQSWFAALEPEFGKPYFKGLNDFLEKERSSSVKIFPPHDKVWSWTHHFPIEETKVVILGQDPYHGPNQAHGLCFSVQKPVRPPPSLVNMYKELSKDIEGFKIPQHGLLTGWAKQGVLMLNACLTVRQAQANSHKDKGWETLTSAVVKQISNQCSGVVFLLWGSYAQKKGDIVDKKKHHLLKSVHPSPLSAHRGFLGCQHFSLCNEILEKQGKSPIDWKRLDDED